MSTTGITLSPFRDESALSSFRFDSNISPHSTNESILIYLSILGSSMIPMRVFESDSIASVKLRIQNWKGFVVKKQKLVFDGSELARNECLVKDYGVADGNVLHVVIKLSDLRAITVKTASGKKFEFHIEHNRNVAYVKKQIAQKEKDFVSPDHQRLIYKGKELDDKLLIKDVLKCDDAVIHLLVSKTSNVRTKPIEKDYEVSINAPVVNNKIPLDDDIEPITCNLLAPKVRIEPFVVNPKVEFPFVIHDLVKSTLEGLENGNFPVMSNEGTGGAYFMQSALGNEYVAVFKPIDEEPMAINNPRGLPLSSNGEGLKKGTRVGEGALREVAAYILDHPLNGRRSLMGDDVGFSGVPPTVMVKCLNEGFNNSNDYQEYKIGSLQMFVKNSGSCEDMGPHSFPTQEVHKIAVLDIRMANADRHAGNILVCKDDSGHIVLIPIDHGYCLPETFEDCTFEWLYWPQARQPFTKKTLEYIKSLDAEQDIALLKFYGWKLSLECSRTLCISTMLLQKGAEKGLTAYDIGNILCRETLNKESKIEKIIQEANGKIKMGSSEAVFLDKVSEIMERYLNDCVSAF